MRPDEVLDLPYLYLCRSALRTTGTRRDRLWLLQLH